MASAGRLTAGLSLKLLIGPVRAGVLLFGDYATHCFGLLTLGEDYLVQGYCHVREHRWR